MPRERVALIDKAGTDMGTSTVGGKPVYQVDIVQAIALGLSQGSFTDRSGTTSGTPSTVTQIMAANSSRKYLLIQNRGTSSIFINFTTDPTTAAAGSLEIKPGGNYELFAGFINTEAVKVISSAASQVYTAKEG